MQWLNIHCKSISCCYCRNALIAPITLLEAWAKGAGLAWQAMAGPVFLIEKIGIIYHLSAKNLQESGNNSAFLPTKKGAAAAAPALALLLTYRAALLIRLR